MAFFTIFEHWRDKKINWNYLDRLINAENTVDITNLAAVHWMLVQILQVSLIFWKPMLIVQSDMSEAKSGNFLIFRL